MTHSEIEGPLLSVVHDKLAEGTEVRIAVQLRAVVSGDAILRRLAEVVSRYSDSVNAKLPGMSVAGRRAWMLRHWPELRPLVITVFAEQGSSHADDQPSHA